MRLNINDEVARLKDKSKALTKSIFAKLSPWQVTRVARHESRPYTQDYLDMIVPDFQELHGDRMFADVCLHHIDIAAYLQHELRTVAQLINAMIFHNEICLRSVECGCMCSVHGQSGDRPTLLGGHDALAVVVALVVRRAARVRRGRADVVVAAAARSPLTAMAPPSAVRPH